MRIQCHTLVSMEYSITNRTSRVPLTPSSTCTDTVINIYINGNIKKVSVTKTRVTELQCYRGLDYYIILHV